MDVILNVGLKYCRDLDAREKAINSMKVNVLDTREPQHDGGQEKRKDRNHANSEMVDEQNQKIQISYIFVS